MTNNTFIPTPSNTLELLTDAERMAQHLNARGISLMGELRTGRTYSGTTVQFISVQTHYGNVDHALYIPQTLAILEGITPSVNRISVIAGPELSSIPVPTVVTEQLKKKLITFPDADLVKSTLSYVEDLPKEHRDAIAKTFHLFITSNLDDGGAVKYLLTYQDTYTFEYIQNLYETHIDSDEINNAFTTFIKTIFIDPSLFDPTTVPQFNLLIPSLKNLDKTKLDTLDPEKQKSTTPELISAITHHNTLLTQLKTHVVVNKTGTQDVVSGTDDLLALVNRYAGNLRVDYITILDRLRDEPHAPCFSVVPTKIDPVEITATAKAMCEIIADLPHKKDQR